jgi:hypothetical protein
MIYPLTSHLTLEGPVLMSEVNKSWRPRLLEEAEANSPKIKSINICGREKASAEMYELALYDPSQHRWTIINGAGTNFGEYSVLNLLALHGKPKEDAENLSQLDQISLPVFVSPLSSFEGVVPACKGCTTQMHSHHLIRSDHWSNRNISDV